MSPAGEAQTISNKKQPSSSPASKLPSIFGHNVGSVKHDEIGKVPLVVSEYLINLCAMSRSVVLVLILGR